MALIQTVSSSGLADVSVFVAPHQGLAELLVCVVSSRGLAQRDDGLWFFVESNPTSRIYCTSSQGSAELVIAYVDYPGLAGWRRAHALQGRL